MGEGGRAANAYEIAHNLRKISRGRTRQIGIFPCFVNELIPPPPGNGASPQIL